MANQSLREKEEKKKFAMDWKKIIARFLFSTLLMGALLFLSAGRLDWWEGWIYLVFTAATLIASRVVLILRYPETAQERMEGGKKGNVKAWDKFLMPLVALILPILAWVIAGLDVRFGWTPPIDNTIKAIGFVVNAAGSLFSVWALLVNRFFSSHVRIQNDRGHTVTRTGPYRFVRHPGYSGGIICWIGTWVFFGSIWMGIPVFLTILALVVRTALEDKTLQKELPGYKEYTREVGFRLFPGIW